MMDGNSYICAKPFTMGIKSILRETLIATGLDLTKNLEYDRLTRKLMRQWIKPGFNCIDIGCHKGEILSDILDLAPGGKHFAFEPIPDLYEQLVKRFGNICSVYPYALADKEGTTTFNYVKNAPAYSGIQKRKYAVETPDISEITVSMKKLDDVVDASTPIHFIKIDVEGGEFNVLKGAQRIITQYSPLVIFEFGKGASDYYGTTSANMYQFITEELGLHIFTLKSWIKKQPALSASAFDKHYEDNSEYYFVASNVPNKP